MSRDRQAWLVLLLGALYALAFRLAEDRGYIPVGYNAVNTIVLAGVLIFLAVQVRRGKLSMPVGFRTLKVGKLVWVGVGLVLASLACLLIDFLLFRNSASSLAALLPVVMFLSGLFLLLAGFAFKILQAMLSR